MIFHVHWFGWSLKFTTSHLYDMAGAKEKHRGHHLFDAFESML